MQVKTKRWIKRAVLGGVALALIGTGVTVYLLQRPPMVWREVKTVLDLSTPEMRKQITARVQDKLAELSESGSSKSQRIDVYGGAARAVETDQISETPLDEFAELTLTNTELVAMVNTFFVQWTNQRGYVVPGGINDPTVIAHAGKLYLAFMIDTPYWQQVFSGQVQLTFQDDGMAVGRVEKLYAGSLPVSVLSVGEMLRINLPKHEHQTADRIGRWLDNLEHFEFRPVIELEHRRRARVLALMAGDEQVTLRMRVQDHRTYRAHNNLLGRNQIAVTDVLNAKLPDGSAFADVPTTTD